MKIEIEITDLDRGHKVAISGDAQAECYCAKSHEIPQAVKDVLVLKFPKK